MGDDGKGDGSARTEAFRTYLDGMRADHIEAFRRLHDEPDPLLLPNAWDFMTAAALAADGHPAVGTTSLGVAAAAGIPDASGALHEETVTLTRRLARLDVLLTVDLEAGGSDDPAEVAAFAAEIADAGGVGINLEDGRPDGTLDTVERHAAKLAAVHAAVPDLFINARTDPYWLEVADPGERLGIALDRTHAYLEAGADGIFVPGVAALADVAALAAGIAAPLNVLYRPGGPTVRELGKAGVRRISTGSLLVRAALREITRVANTLRESEEPDLTGTPSYHEVDALSQQPPSARDRGPGPVGVDSSGRSG